jgi:hypothetical protein
LYLGEHIADYYCLEKFGNPSDWSGHDKGSNGKWRKKGTAYKLNDNGVLKRLKPSDSRGGITMTKCITIHHSGL